MENKEYIDAVCQGEPLDKPSYDSEADTWDLYFEESPTNYHLDTTQDLLSVSFESKAEAYRAYHHYSQPTKG
jgi:hypothetical protein